MFSQIVMVHFKLKLKLVEKGLVPKQIDLFQIQPETEGVQPSALRVNVQGDLSSLPVPHTGGTSSAWGGVESGALAPCGCLTQQEPVKVNLNLLKQYVHQIPKGK